MALAIAFTFEAPQQVLARVNPPTWLLLMHCCCHLLPEVDGPLLRSIAPLQAITFTLNGQSRSITASESPSRSDYPRIMANNNSAGLGGFCHFRGPHERQADKRFGLIMQSTAA